MSIYKVREFINSINKHHILFKSVFLIWIFRMVIPQVYFVLIPAVLLLCFVIYDFIISGHKILKYEFVQVFTPVWILLLLYLAGMIFSEEWYKKNFIDLFEFTVNMIIVAYIFFFVYRENNHVAFKNLFEDIISLVRGSVLLVALFYLILISAQMFGVQAARIQTFTWHLISIDKMFLFIGLACYLPDMFKLKLPNKEIVVLQLKIAIIGLSILLSGSLKSWMMLAILFLILFIFFIASIITRKLIFLNFRRNSYIIIILGIVFSGIILFFPQKVGLQSEFSISIFEQLVTEFHFNKWVYTFSVFSQYNILEMFFGSGFDYLNLFKTQFMLESHDYPHNPILSSLLYSGLIGAAFTFTFLVLTLYYSLKYFKQYPAFTIMLLLSLFFSMFSGNSIFSIPYFLFLFTISFLIRHIETTDFILHFNLKNRIGQVIKELFDFILSTSMFLVLLPILIAIAVTIRIKMGSPIFFIQNRVGRNGQLFKLYKFRTMTIAKKHVTGVAAAETARITKLGKFLRKTKLDELPELVNIILGDMSFVGPRPDVPGYADNLKGNDRLILELKPGLTGPASLKYRNEEEILKLQPNPIQYNDEIIFPDKVRINLLYMENWNLFLDILLIIKTGTGGKFDENDYFNENRQS